MISEKNLVRILIVFIFVGTILRFYQLGFQCYWTEEQYTLGMAKLPFMEILSTSILTDFNPPLYYLFAHAVTILGDSAVNTVNAGLAIRWPSVICGILLIPAMYVLGYVYKNSMTVLYCAGFTTILFPLVYYSQFGRAYSMSFLFFVLALIVYIRIKDGDHSYGTKATFGILAGLNLWIHLFSVIPIGLMMADLILCNGKKMTRAVIITGIMSSPFIYTAVSFLKTRITTAPASGIDQGFGMTLSQILFTIPFEFFSTVFPYFGFLTIIGLNEIYKTKDEIGTKMIIIAILTIGVGVICSFATPVFPRYFMTVSFIFILISATVCANFTETIESDNGKVMFLFGILGLMLLLQNGSYLAHYFSQKYVC